MSGTKPTPVRVDTRILVIRGLSVILDVDLSSLYGVAPSALLQAVRRNRNRFPSDFLFQLDNQELTNLKSQPVISSSSRTGSEDPKLFIALPWLDTLGDSKNVPPRQ